MKGFWDCRGKGGRTASVGAATGRGGMCDGVTGSWGDGGVAGDGVAGG